MKLCFAKQKKNTSPIVAMHQNFDSCKKLYRTITIFFSIFGLPVVVIVEGYICRPYENTIFQSHPTIENAKKWSKDKIIKRSRSLSLVCLHCRKSQSLGPVVCMCAKVPFLSGCEVNIPCDGALLFWANSLSVTQKSSSFLSAS
jgi:hypothetical protein